MRTNLEQVADGDSAAVQRCVESYGSLVYRLARRYLDHAPAEVDDAVQEVFIEVWLNAKRFDPSLGSEAAFIATIAHRRIIDRQRQVTSRKRMEKRAAIVAEIKPAWSTTLQEGGVDVTNVYRDELTKSLKGLPADEQAVIWLSVYHGLSHRQIASATDSPVGTVKTRLRRAMMSITKALVDRTTRTASAQAGQGGDR